MVVVTVACSVYLQVADVLQVGASVQQRHTQLQLDTLLMQVHVPCEQHFGLLPC